MLDAVNLPLGRALKRERLTDLNLPFVVI